MSCLLLLYIRLTHHRGSTGLCKWDYSRFLARTTSSVYFQNPKEVLVWVSVFGGVVKTERGTMLAMEEHPEVTWKYEVSEDMDVDLILLSQ